MKVETGVGMRVGWVLMDVEWMLICGAWNSGERGSGRGVDVDMSVICVCDGCGMYFLYLTPK